MAESNVVEYSRALKHQLIEKLTTEMKQAEQNKESMDEKFEPNVSKTPKLPFYRRGYITGGRKRSIGDDGTADRKRWRFNPVTSKVRYVGHTRTPTNNNSNINVAVCAFPLANVLERLVMGRNVTCPSVFLFEMVSC